MRTAWQLWRDGRGDGSAVARRRTARLDALVAFARSRSPYYGTLYRGLPDGPVDLHRLPPVSKPDLMAEFDRWVTDPQVSRAGVEAFVADPDNIGRGYLGRYLVFTTSGTTGVPALLLQDRQALDVFTALAGVRAAAPMLRPSTIRAVIRGGGRSASVWATGRPFGGASLVRRQILQRPSRARRMRIFSALSPVDALVDELNAYQPAMLSGYASALALLANEQRVGRLAIHPAIINNGGETLTSAARTRIESAFGVPVGNGYGSSEMLMIAYACGYGSMHVNADWVVLEPVDEARRPVPAGERSTTVLLTNLANRVQPIIRYDLGDAVRIRPVPCRCRSPLPSIDVVGRTNETLSLRTADGHTVELLPLPLVALVEGVAGVRGVQLVQVSPHVLRVRLDVEPDHDDARVWRDVETALRMRLRQQSLDAVGLARDDLPPQRDRRSGKLRQTIIAAARNGAPDSGG